MRRDGEGVGAIGLAGDRPGWDLAAGSLLFLVVAAGGIAIYLGAVHLGVNRFVIPAPPPDHWWTYPAVFMNAAGAALLEEVIVLAYLLTRLRQMGWSPVAAVLASAVLRGGYHLYQGWGGFAGNFLMGLLFGVLFLRWRRTWPFVVAHFLLDAGAAHRVPAVPPAPARLLSPSGILLGRGTSTKTDPRPARRGFVFPGPFLARSWGPLRSRC